MRREDIVCAARDLIGTPFKHQGRRPQIELDCAGLLVVVAGELGVEVHDQQGYGRRPANDLLRAALDSQAALVSVPLAEMQSGDLLLMRVVRDPQHLAIFAGYNHTCESETIIHAEIGAGKVCEHRLDDAWRARIVRVYRFAEAA